jgi:hypothetical protein
MESAAGAWIVEQAERMKMRIRDKTDRFLIIFMLSSHMFDETVRLAVSQLSPVSGWIVAKNS